MSNPSDALHRLEKEMEDEQKALRHERDIVRALETTKDGLKQELVATEIQQKKSDEKIRHIENDHARHLAELRKLEFAIRELGEKQ